MILSFVDTETGPYYATTRIRDQGTKRSPRHSVRGSGVVPEYYWRSRGRSLRPGLWRGGRVSALRAVEVRTAAADEVPKVAAAFADAFVDDPVFRFLRPAGLRNGGTVWTTSGHDGAVAVLPPGAWELPKSMTGREALEWLRAFRTRLPRASKVQRAMEEHHPRAPHFYLRTVGVRTALQGQGIGSMLMQPTLERADSAGLPTYLEASSERSAALYERLGFRHTGAFELPGGGPLVWPMLRPVAAN
jgi:GNAT superfamily N-acetyltransferase